MFLKLNIILNLNNTTYVAESSIWNTLIPSRHELTNSDDNVNEEDDVGDDDVGDDKDNDQC